MRRFLIVGGSVGAGVVLVLAMLSSVVSAQTIKPEEAKTHIFQRVKNYLDDRLWEPGDLFLTIIILLMVLIELIYPGGEF